MWKRVIRCVSDEEKVRILRKTAGNFRAKEDIHWTHPSLKSKNTIEERFTEMKAKFGKDYQTPFDKYDLHLPRVDAPDFGKSQYDRHHERDEYAGSRKILKLIWVGLFCVCVYVAKTHLEDRKYNREMRVKEKKLAKFNDEQAERRNMVLQKKKKILEATQGKDKKDFRLSN